MESVAKKISKLSKEEEMQGIYLKEEQEAFIRDQIKAYAMKDGYNDGLEKGMAKGMEKGLKEGIEKGLKEGHTKGHAEGLEEGALNKQQEIVINMLNKNMDIKTISDITGLSTCEIEKLQK